MKTLYAAFKHKLPYWGYKVITKNKTVNVIKGGQKSYKDIRCEKVNIPLARYRLWNFASMTYFMYSQSYRSTFFHLSDVQHSRHRLTPPSTPVWPRLQELDKHFFLLKRNHTIDYLSNVRNNHINYVNYLRVLAFVDRYLSNLRKNSSFTINLLKMSSSGTERPKDVINETENPPVMWIDFSLT